VLFPPIAAISERRFLLNFLALALPPHAGEEADYLFLGWVS